MKRRVVVTGMGAVTPIGNTVEEFWNNVKAGTVGIQEITKFDTTDYKVKLAGEVKGFVAKECMDFKSAKRMEPFSQYAVAAAKEAFEQAEIDMQREDPFRKMCIRDRAGYIQKQREGQNSGTWVLLDYGDIIVHVFDTESRSFYNLERIWSDGKQIELQKN